MTLNTMLTRVKNVTARSYRRNPLVREFKRLNDALERMQRPKQRRTCPICLACFEEYVPFRNRQKARCPSCGSFERHRLSWLYLTRETRLLHEPTRFLHFAPEEILRARIASNFNVTYTPASYDPSLPEPGIDIQALPFADATFDLTYCSHVLEHIPDDRLAMRELFRVLCPGGRAIVMVPTRNIANTHEDPNVTSPEERTKQFGRHDHLRLYGRDLIARLEEAGFVVRTVYHHLSLSVDEQLHYGVQPEPIFDCLKPAR